MPSFFVTHNNSIFHYRRFGNGASLLFCFHGYGRDSNTFGFLQHYLSHRYTIIAIDAPHHGETHFDDKVFQPKDLVTVLKKIAETEGKSTNKFSLLGYSMGGRIALNVTHLLASQIERVVLLAPDGLKFNFWHWFSTHTWIGNKVFDYTVHRPAWLLKVVAIAEKKGLINKNLAGFVRYYLGDSEERMILYRRWIIMRKFRPHLSSIKKIIRSNKIKVRILFGRYDRIIHSSGGHAFLKSLDQYASITIIDAGHDLLRQWHADTIASLFNE